MLAARNVATTPTYSTGTYTVAPWPYEPVEVVIFSYMAVVR